MQVGPPCRQLHPAIRSPLWRPASEAAAAGFSAEIRAPGLVWHRKIWGAYLLPGQQGHSPTLPSPHLEPWQTLLIQPSFILQGVCAGHSRPGGLRLR